VAIFLFAIDQSPLPAIIILSPVHQTGYMLWNTPGWRVGCTGLLWTMVLGRDLGRVEVSHRAIVTCLVALHLAVTCGVMVLNQDRLPNRETSIQYASSNCILLSHPKTGQNIPKSSIWIHPKNPYQKRYQNSTILRYQKCIGNIPFSTVQKPESWNMFLAKF
jgi:hypothetical protein